MTPPDALPFAAGREQLLRALSDCRAAVIQAPPGTGKTTLAPGYLRDFLRQHPDWPSKVIVTQPRRIAARSAATRAAELSNSPLGSAVGFTVRGERAVSADTEIEFVTPGVLLRRLLRDPDLPGVGAVILDEVHERHIDSDLVFGMLAQLRELRDDLAVVAMSATVDAQRFAGLLHAPVVDVPSPIHPLNILYATSANALTPHNAQLPAGAPDSVEEVVFRHVCTAVEHTHPHGGDILVFVPTIRGTEILADRINSAGQIAGIPVEAMPLHGKLTPREQSVVIGSRAATGSGSAELSRLRGCRRIIVATDVAESSLTVPGVRVVVDSCLARLSRRDTTRGMSLLVTESASQASSIQRGGRAGREGPGDVFRCVTAEQWQKLPAFSPASVTTSDLTSAMLSCAVWGAPGGEDLPLPEPFPERAARVATETLRRLGAVQRVDAEHPWGEVTPLGRRLAGMPLEPHLARGGLLAVQRVDPLLVAQTLVTLDESARLSGTLVQAVQRRSARDPQVRRLVGLLTSATGELTSTKPADGELVPVTRNAEQDHSQGDCAPTGSAPVGDKQRGERLQGEEAIAYTVACAFPQLIARVINSHPAGSATGSASAGGARSAGGASGAVANPAARAHRPATVLTVGGTGAQLPCELQHVAQSTSSAGRQWLAIADIARARTGDGTGARVRQALGLSEELAILAAGGVETARTCTFDVASGRAHAREVRMVGAVELGVSPVQPTSQEARQAISEALQSGGLDALQLPDSARALLRRMAFAHRQQVSGYPDLSAGWPEDVLAFLVEDLVAQRPPDVAGLLRGVIPWDQPIDQVAPEWWDLPSGRRVRVIYPEVGDADSPPVIATKLQDAFGLFESPSIAGQRVQFHLLSPAGRPLAVTDDLASFWSGPYAGVRKDMRGRYPKHAWPEDPSTL